ncbi:small glutamine-rich tetratricopeptide repeat-containing protein beta [Frankliniella occidentalis]|uniref:Small glutamine-rich tetratricopeptide repeat-containing protein beta n=1 Tax=Frankliniella occidentalis TaxID=133901 RepID=A0A6J1T416_FRAOC|nr:small glutamine-rich tetratricopeptide repeat-containing protein beta [Frankliniella occidentalis]
MSSVKHLVASIVHFLNDQMHNGGLSSDAVESLEVAIQCLESAYSVSGADEALRPTTPLLDIFRDYSGTLEDAEELPPEASPECKAEAERLKAEGNSLMHEEKYQEAIDAYSKAIALDGRNAIYYCNRAAVHSKLNNYQQSIADAKQALKIDSSYCKAYARLGLAHASLGQHEEARNAYAKALEMEPDNESYKNNMQLAQEKITGAGPSPFLMGGEPNLANLGPIGSMLGNSNLMAMASQVLSDPNMHRITQNVYSNLVSGNPQGSTGAMDALLRAGQQLAEHMQSANPELVEQLRRQLDTQNQNNGAPGEEPPAPPSI